MSSKEGSPVQNVRSSAKHSSTKYSPKRQALNFLDDSIEFKKGPSANFMPLVG